VKIDYCRIEKFLNFFTANKNSKMIKPCFREKILSKMNEEIELAITLCKEAERSGPVRAI
jgi:hypothetical protein